MFIWEIIQGCLLLSIFVIVLTQIIIPAIFGKPLFWFFRKADSDLLKAQRQLSDTELSERVKDIKDKIRKKSRRTRQ